ncbi:D-aminoacyl-tRNA deacylase-like [Halichondria panicea]|uniref:D-aminoacyl-tRNA deacylase-like n=1 Tax=Halichondria panicea TaxID=6063 RepID=UPI00312B8DB2
MRLQVVNAMKVVVQRVTGAKVTVDGREVSCINQGLCVLLGIARDDSQKEAEWMAKKVLNLRLFDNPADGKPWDKSASDLGLEILCVSQFTLCHVLKGNKPDFHNAMHSDLSNPMYQDFLKLLGSLYKPEAIKGGEFGANMQVHIQNDGPVTLQFETPNIPKPKERKPQKTSKKECAKAPEGAIASDSVTAAAAELSIQDS